MILRPGLLLLLVLLAGSATVAGASRQVPIPAVVIQVSATQRVQLAPVDADAFQRRLNQPPIVAAPRTPGAGVIVSSAYWDAAVRRDDAEPRVDADGEYFANGGFVRARQAGRDVWLVIDLRQRAILDRYVRLARDGDISPQPGVLEVLAAASRAEQISIEIGSRRLSDVESATFWRLVVGLAPPALQSPNAEPPRDGPGGVWITFALEEGRAVPLRYTVGSGTLVDAFAQEVYAVPRDWLQPILGDYGPDTIGRLTPQIEQAAPAGSLLWWPVMIGGGVACLAAAVWLRRRSA